jgi:preprotein translocase subunit SecB
MAADDKTGRSGAGNGSGNSSANEPVVQLLGQYVKDLSFENPNAPQSFLQQQAQSKLDVKIGVAVREIAANTHEVSLNIENRLGNDKATLFQLELDYAGAFRIENLPPEIQHQVLRVQCPTLLFPFARRLVADLTRDGGFPQLYLDPVDFAQLYVQEAARIQAAGSKLTA